MSSSDDSNDDDDDRGEQIRISLTLASECRDKSLQVANLPSIAVPADVGRKGLSAVVNHLLDRRLLGEDEMEDDDRLAAIPFDFIVGGANSTNRRLLRTGIEREARRSGLSLEEAITVTYFPAQEAPELFGESEQLPDWISAVSFVNTSGRHNNILCAGCYDGSISVFQAKGKGSAVVLEKMTTKDQQHGGAIKCMDAVADDSADDNTVWVAAGSMAHTMQIYKLDTDSFKMKLFANCKDGHAAAIGSVDLFARSGHKLLASGDWDGAVCVWDCTQQPVTPADQEQPIKKTKTENASSSNTEVAEPTLAPKISIQAHSSQVSGISWGNYEKFNKETGDDTAPPLHLITGSWDHSLKVWDIERQDCLLTLNGSRVVSCLDTSYHSTGVVATGHPDCTIRLWDTRTAEDSKESSLMMTVSDNTFRPSHKEWISAVRWSSQNPYHLASTSHDGTIKLWDIRSPLPLHTVRAFPKSQKGLSLTYGGDESGLIFAGGTDCIVKQFHCSRTTTEAESQ